MTASHARSAALAALFLFLFLALPLAGCRDDLTQVVLVIESDLTVPQEVDGVDVLSTAGPFAPSVPSFFEGNGMEAQSFPMAVGFVSNGKTSDFSFVVRFFHGVFQGVIPTLVTSRTVSDVRFVDQQTMMLELQMLRVCACQGSTCPSPGTNPACDNIDQPPLVPFDPAVAPKSTNMAAPGVNGGGILR